MYSTERHIVTVLTSDVQVLKMNHRQSIAGSFNSLNGSIMVGPAKLRLPVIIEEIDHVADHQCIVIDKFMNFHVLFNIVIFEWGGRCCILCKYRTGTASINGVYIRIGIINVKIRIDNVNAKWIDTSVIDIDHVLDEH